MTKLEIVKQIARETGVETAVVSVVAEGFMEEIRAAQIRKENVYLRGFGTFLIKHRKEKTARNITKNTTIVIPADVRIGESSFYRCRRQVRHSGAHGLRGTSPARRPSRGGASSPSIAARGHVAVSVSASGSTVCLLTAVWRPIVPWPVSPPSDAELRCVR